MKRATCSVTSFKDLKKALDAVRERGASRAAQKDVSSGTREAPSSRSCEGRGIDSPSVEAAAVQDTHGDQNLFQEAMADVKEIREFREMPFRTPVRAARRQSCPGEDVLDALKDLVEGRRRMNIRDTGEYIEWTGPRTRKDVTERLHEGHFSVQDYVDLHGMSLAEAEAALTAFMRQSLSRGFFCVKVIHGRGLRSPGGPVLKKAIQKWLQTSFSKWVVAYASAKDCDGGLGATYVILRTR
jgi:DNA-nicking Smr family endonuclease